MSKPLLLTDDPTPFREWLESQKPEAVVGHKENCAACPLARYLQRPDVFGVRVSAGRYRYHHGNEYFGSPLPDWAKRFVAWVDDTSAPVVTAQDALRCLDEATAGNGEAQP